MLDPRQLHSEGKRTGKKYQGQKDWHKRYINTVKEPDDTEDIESEGVIYSGIKSKMIPDTMYTRKRINLKIFFAFCDAIYREKNAVEGVKNSVAERCSKFSLRYIDRDAVDVAFQEWLKGLHG